jgi:Xaa-Pro aminopeptidase
MRRAYISGFRGSAGTAVVTTTEALLWTDSRYWNEASIQLDATLWKLQKGGSPDVLTIPKWLGETAKEYYQQHQKPMIIGIDPYERYYVRDCQNGKFSRKSLFDTNIE